MSSLTPQVVEDVDRIVESLGHFALAIKLAGAYVASNPYMKARLGEYLSQLSADERGFLNQQPQRHIDRYEQSIRRSWEMCCDAIAAKCPAALNLLSLLAFMDASCIEPGRFERGELDGSDGVTTANKDTNLRWRTVISEREPWIESLRIAFATLSDFSLIQWSCDNDCYNMHQLVQSWSFERLSASESHLFGTAALIMLSNRGTPSVYHRTCLLRIASIPNASASDRLVTSKRFGTRGAYHGVTESPLEEIEDLVPEDLCFNSDSWTIGIPRVIEWAQTNASTCSSEFVTFTGGNFV
jgi:hypothetical protein